MAIFKKAAARRQQKQQVKVAAKAERGGLTRSQYARQKRVQTRQDARTARAMAGEPSAFEKAKDFTTSAVGAFAAGMTQGDSNVNNNANVNPSDTSETSGGSNLSNLFKGDESKTGVDPSGNPSDAGSGNKMWIVVAIAVVVIFWKKIASSFRK